MALNSGNSCPAIFSAWSFTCWGDKLRLTVFHLASKEVWNIYRKTPVIYALTIPRPPLLLWCIYLFKVVPRYPGGASPRLSYGVSPPPPRARYNESRCNEVLRITDGCSYPSKSKIYELKEPWYNEVTSKFYYATIQWTIIFQLEALYSFPPCFLYFKS